MGEFFGSDIRGQTPQMLEKRKGAWSDEKRVVCRF